MSEVNNVWFWSIILTLNVFFAVLNLLRGLKSKNETVDQGVTQVAHFFVAGFSFVAALICILELSK